MSNAPWKVFHVGNLVGNIADAETRYLEFLHAPTLKCAVYRLPAGKRDSQVPHRDDEVYVVVQGCARFHVGGQECSVSPGTVIYVQAASQHAFFDIAEDLTVLVLFAKSAPVHWQAMTANPFYAASTPHQQASGGSG